MKNDQPLLELRGISKSFPGVKALDSVQLKLYPGQVTALIGENGAGKSTLVKTMTGIYNPDEGQIFFDGELVEISTPESARAMGITAIHQETVLFDDLSVTENIFAGQYKKTTLGVLDWRGMHAAARDILARIDAPIEPTMPLRELSIGQRHMVAIARALSFDARVVVLDEPTAALSYREIQELYQIVERLKAQGCAVMFISHKFDEIFRISDQFAVFRDGQFVSEGMIQDVSEKQLVQMMVGRSVDQVFPKADVELGEIVLSVKNLCHPTEFNDISFDLKAGEILGFYGLVGAGRTELMQALFGVSSGITGTVTKGGEPLSINSPADAIREGIVYVPEERQTQGGVLELPIYQNIGLPQLTKLGRWGMLNTEAEYDLAEQYGARLRVKAPNWFETLGNLSGGNQQKVVIAKWLATRPDVIILDEPTKGIDIGSKASVHEFMADLVREGLAVIMVSSELPEVMGMADRVIVMHEGLNVAEFERAAFSAEGIVRAATGGGH